MGKATKFYAHELVEHKMQLYLGLSFSYLTLKRSLAMNELSLQSALLAYVSIFQVYSGAQLMATFSFGFCVHDY